MGITSTRNFGHGLTLAITIALVSCGGSNSSTPPSPPPSKVTITLSQASSSVAVSSTLQLTATVHGTSNLAVAWAVDAVSGGNATVGTISTAGLYTAPSMAGTHTVTATSAADATKSISAPVKVQETIAVSPSTATVAAGTTQQFSATIQGASNKAVLWSVDTISGGNSTVGTISTAGLYTAPSMAGTHTVTATSVADPTRNISATATVQDTIAISPATAVVLVGMTQQFSATIQGLSNTTASWSVDTISGGNATVGTISAAGLYTAPSLAGTHSVTATSIADITKSVSATVTVQDTIAISPATAVVAVGLTQQFSATIQGLSNTTASWSVDTISGGNATVGTISASGLYTAPLLAGTHTIAATSVADTTKSASATVTVQPTIALSPATADVAAAMTQQFNATIQGVSNTTASWSVDMINGGNATVGTISAAGLYTAPSLAGTHTITATSVADTTKSASASVAIFTFSISPVAAVVGPSGTQQFSATIQGLTNTAVTWSVDGISGGNSTTGTITSSGMFTAPFATGAHSIAATSVGDPLASVTSPLTVINSSPGAVLTYHNDDARDGAFIEETTLMPSNVNSSQFGKVLSYAVDGQMYAQPLYLPQLSISGVNHNVVFVATENDTVYAFDADGSQVTPLWSKSLGVPVSKQNIEGVSPLLGITSTPALDVTTGTLYVVAETTDGPFKLHALDVTSGAEKFGGPILITGSVPGTGWDSSGGIIALEPDCYQRMGVVLNPVNNMIDLAFGHCNHGWVLAYDKTTLQQTAIFNDTPDGAGGALWAGGGTPAIDDGTGDLYLITGVDAGDPGLGFNDSFLRLSAKDLSVLDYFMPDNEAFLRVNDADLGSGAAILMPDNSSSTPHETIGGGKDGRIFVVNRDNMGTFSPTTNNVVQTVQTGVKQFDNIFSTPVYWNGFLYYHCEDDVLHAFSWSNGLLSTQPVSSATTIFSTHGATASVSANGTSNGIIWEIDNSNFATLGPSVLHAYDATNVATELYNSSQAGSRDTAGLALKFTVPTIAGGKVFVGTSNELDIYGLLVP